MGRKLWAVPLLKRGAGSPPNTMLPGPRLTSMQSFILIRRKVVVACRHQTVIGSNLTVKNPAVGLSQMRRQRTF